MCTYIVVIKQNKAVKLKCRGEMLMIGFKIEADKHENQYYKT